MKEDILYRINDTNYVLIEVLVTGSNQNVVNMVSKRLNCIAQGIKEINRGGFWSNTYAIVKILVPEQNIAEFQNSI